MGVTYRQAKRVWRRYRVEGDAGLVHRSRGRPSPRSKPSELRQRVLARYEERYGDFGPTLAAEYLAGEGLGVDHETLRRWLIAEGTRKVRRRGQRHRAWRERKACFGMMVQLDGSHHDWFEGRRAQAVLMVMVDDATNQVWAQFSEAETTRASYDVLEGWVRQRGLPQSLYVDRDSIYRCEGVGSVAEQLAGQAPQTQFGRAMGQLGVELILANSPQAKGRVERMNGVLQDRLVKALRLGRDQRVGAGQRVSGPSVSAGAEPAVPARGGQSRGRASGCAAEPGRSIELGRRASGAAGLDSGVRGALASGGAGTRVLESGGQESGGAGATGWTGAVGASGPETALASLAGTAPAEGGGAEGPKAACGGEARGKTSVAAIRMGRGAGVLARSQSAGAGPTRGDPAGGQGLLVGLRYAPASLRPWPPAGGNRSTNNNLRRGHFLVS